MSTKEKACWLALFANPEVDRAQAKQAVYQWAIEEQRPLEALAGLNASALCRRLPGLATDQALCWERGFQHLDRYLAQLATLQSQGIDIITRADAAYPENLATRLPERWLPYVLYYRGDLALLGFPTVHIAGTDSPTQEASHLIEEIAENLVMTPVALLGGYDQGVDRQALAAGSRAGACTILILPLGFNHAQAILKAGQSDLERGHRLELSPFEPNIPYAPSLGRARSLLVTAMAEVLLLIAPQQSPEEWPALDPFLRDGGALLIWQGSDEALLAQWEKVGATPFRYADEALRWLSTRLQFGEEEISPSDTLASPEEAPPVYFGDAESAIMRLSQTGRVPEKLAQRLREAEKRGWLGKT